MAFSKYSGIFTSAELALLQRVFDQLCMERRLELDDADQRDRLAQEVIQAFENGVTDEVELLAISKRRAARA
ncbi:MULTISPECIES: hypothetical protein [unclassified Mesorhizobium]|uniref:hypothetical protein n=1 Tax=unclassified Mesorhizobium TaxID=325217 RepID=UPI0013E0A78E|nr:MULTISPECIES: hypothetical protein [unclassified Mesorhizobium]